MDTLSKMPHHTEKQPRRFSWLILAATVLAVGLTAAMGVWQMSRAAQKTALAEQIRQQMQLPALTLHGDEGQDFWQTQLHRSVQVRGKWLPEHTVYLENRQMDGKPGFWVMTPMLLEGRAQAVLVQRGWVQRNFQDRSAVPRLSTGTHTFVLEGRIAPHVAKLLDLGDVQAGRIRQNLDLSLYAQETRLSLLPVLVLQTGADDDGLRRQWPAVDTGVQKHHGYAFQWFALSTTLVILYVWFQFLLPRRKNRTAA
jgi:surfeit locus 1 family protein